MTNILDQALCAAEFLRELVRKGKDGFQNEEVADRMMKCRGAGKRRASEQPVIARETGRAGLALPDDLKLKSSKAEDTAQWWAVCSTHMWLCSDDQCIKGKEIEFNLGANSCVSGERKSGICSSSKIQGKREACDLLFP